MALIKSKELNNGVVIDYWKIHKTDINWHDKECVVLVTGYLSKEHRFDNCSCIDNYHFNWRGDDFPLSEEGGTIEQLYAKLKESILATKYDDGIEEEVETNFFIDAVNDF